MSITVGDRVQTINTLCPISGEVIEDYGNTDVINDYAAETYDDRLEFHKSDLEVA